MRRIREINVGEVTNAKLKDWMTNNKFEELVNAFALVDNFRTRRLMIDKLAEADPPLAIAALANVASYTHDDVLVNEIVKKIAALDPQVVARELGYDPADAKLKYTVVWLMSLLKSDAFVEPLTAALVDQDNRVRAKSIEALSAMIEPSKDWFGHLVTVIARDPDPDVRLAAARALQAADSQAAFQALDQAMKENTLDDPIRQVHEAMVVKFRSGDMDSRMAKLQEQKKKDRQKEAAQKRTSTLTPRTIGMAAALAVILILGLAFTIYRINAMMGGSVGQLGPIPTPAPLPPGQTLRDQFDQILEDARKQGESGQRRAPAPNAPRR